MQNLRLKVVGSESPNCDVVTGQCLCRNHVEGRQCDRCVENRYDLYQGCLPCDDCYKLVQDRVNENRVIVKEMKSTLQEIIDNPAPVNDTEFDSKFDKIEVQVAKLVENVKEKLSGDDSKLVEKINEKKNSLTEALNSLKNVDDIALKINTVADKTREVLLRWNNVKARAKSDLDGALRHLQTNGQEALEKAELASKQFGEQSAKMTEIARTARQMAETHMNRSLEIQKLAEKTLNASRLAHEAANEAIYGGQETSKEISRLKDDLKATEDLLNNTRQLAADQKKRAEEINQKAAEAMSAADSMKLPNFNLETIREEAKRIQDEAAETVKNVEDIISQNKERFDEAERTIAEARYQLQRAREQQSGADNLLADVDSSRGRAQEAVDRAEKILKEAKEIVKSLQNFNQNNDESKEAALKELEKVDDIRKTIQDAKDKNQAASDAMGDAEKDTKVAFEQAVEARKKSEELKEKSAEFKKQVEQTIENLEKTKKEIDGLEEPITDTSKTLDNYKENSSKDMEKATDSVNTAAKAKKLALEANNTVTSSEDKLKHIIAQLNSLDEIDESELDELEKFLDSTDELVKGADLQGQSDKLVSEARDSERQLKQLKSLIAQTAAEVKNLEAVRDALPMQCFTQVNLEAEGQK
ncbi:hypothetical protein L596_030045 [Steinernema carpocapsae]|uniref:Laminin EGF-like domain-containing protein n=1 Tax=Steinernema carpocapsae TaxID=34508 RepID=A0A4U5LRK1_STECR|nr:hypothetical protein L596_030045 [Steinernema carpocapsae]